MNEIKHVAREDRCPGISYTEMLEGDTRTPPDYLFEESNIDQVILLNQAGANTHEHICESLELFAREVMPEFHAREPEHQAWKRAVLAGEIELEEIDTTPHTFRTTATPTLDTSGARRSEAGS